MSDDSILGGQEVSKGARRDEPTVEDFGVDEGHQTVKGRPSLDGQRVGMTLSDGGSITPLMLFVLGTSFGYFLGTLVTLLVL